MPRGDLTTHGRLEISTDHRHRPVADRPYPALQRDLYRRVHADPRWFAGLPEASARLRARAFCYVRRRCEACRARGDKNRDALSARRLRHLRRLQGQRYNRGVKCVRQVDRRRARHDGEKPPNLQACRACADFKHCTCRWITSTSATATTLSRRASGHWPRIAKRATAARSTSWTATGLHSTTVRSSGVLHVGVAGQHGRRDRDNLES